MRTPLKIMVVDPDHNAVLKMANMFRQQGWETVVAGDAVTAQSTIRKEKPELIVLSSHLPGGGAALVVRRIRSSVHTVGTPVVVLGKAGAPVGEILAAGANEYLKPPLNVAELCTVIRGLVTHETAQQETAQQQTVQQTPQQQMPPQGSMQSAVAPSATSFAASSGSAAAVAPALAPVVASTLASISAPILSPAEVIASVHRLTALAAAEVLDSPPSKLLDSITHIAAATLDVPTVLLSIVDEDRQFFKSHFGLPEPWSTKRQTPLSHSFCQWVASSEEELVVEDAREVPALRGNLAVQDLGVIAYAGVPVTWNFLSAATPGGQGRGSAILGSFCAIDLKPRAWSPEEMANLRNLARMAEAGLLLEKSEKINTDGVTRARAAATIILNSTQLLRRNDECTTGGRPFHIARSLLLELLETQAQDTVRWLS